MRIINRTTGEEIRLARLKLGLTQDQLAAKVNALLPTEELIERSIISRWEQDKNFPRNQRRKILEEQLGISLGSPPPRRESFVAYLTNRSEIEKSLQNALGNSSELWFTNTVGQSMIWHEMPSVKKLFEKLRRSKSVFVKEIMYVREPADVKVLQAMTEQNYPGYRLRVRVAPAHPLPVLLDPNQKYGLFLSGFSDDLPSVGLELSGQPSGFVEHYFRHLWSRGTVIFEDGKINASNLRRCCDNLPNTTQPGDYKAG